MKVRQTHLSKPPVKKLNPRNVKRKPNATAKFYEHVGKKNPKDIMEQAISVYGKENFYALYSGGRDSGLVVEWLSEHDYLKSIVHVNTGVAMQMTTDFVKDICQEKGWDLIVIEPKPKYKFADICLEFGFPGPSFHRVVMGFLKFQPMRNFFMSLNDEKASFVSGIRQMESKRRAKNFTSPYNEDSNMWFTAPFYYYTNEEMYKMRITQNIKTSPAYETGVGISGDCLCGAYASYQEKAALKKADPHLATYIEWLEEGVKQFGTEYAKKHPRWGQTSSMTDIEQQTVLDHVLEKEGFTASEMAENQICGTDCGPGTMRGMMDI